ncbi:MAG: hypothetical protein GY866_17300 [Proteobacteria bacterium]|nr:hypothetical protein [Pseudomonadota bacterium]
MIKYMKELESEEQKWLARAVVVIILTGGIVEQDQVVFIKKLCSVFLDEEPKETLEEISTLLKDRELPELAYIDVADIEHLIFMLDVLTASVFANGKKLHEETAKYFEIGKKLGVNIGTLSYRLSLEAERFRVKRKLVEIKNSIREDRSHTFIPKT